MIWQTKSIDSADTERLGESLGKLLKGGEIIELRSDLGGGKTTFARGLARGAGSKDNVASPTFTLNRQYQAGDLVISHFDFYRLTEPGLMSDQLAESFENGHIVVVEWADIVKDVLPEERLCIELKQSAISQDERDITISYPENMETMVLQLRAGWMESKP